MKTYEEMAHSALERIKEYKEEQKIRRKKAIKIAVPTVSLCIAAVVCINLWQLNSSKAEFTVADTNNGAAEQESITLYSNSAETQTDSDGLYEEDGTVNNESPTNKGASPSDETAQDLCFFWWKNKLTMSGDLYNAIEKDKNGTFKVLAAYRPATENITSFTYEGKTLANLAIDAENEKILPDKMRELLKCGDELKYGTVLYETGTPSGEKWYKELYEEKVTYFGKELLDKYIVDGEFLRNMLEKDIAEYNEDSANRKYKAAFNAYLETVVPSAVKKLNDNNIKCERDKYTNNCIIFTANAKELENLPLDDLKYWQFSLTSNDKKNISGDESITTDTKGVK